MLGGKSPFFILLQSAVSNSRYQHSLYQDSHPLAPKMRASIILALASAAAASSVLKRTVGVVRRQGEAFDPDEIPFTGECSDLGPTYVECGPLLCIDPAAGESCCDNQCM